MSLNKGDLTAIKQAVDLSIAEKLTKLVMPMFRELELRINGAFGEMQDKINVIQQNINVIKDTVGRIELVQRAELERNDRQDLDIKQIRKSPYAA